VIGLVVFANFVLIIMETDIGVSGQPLPMWLQVLNIMGFHG